jgi:hypothetical protein
LVSGTEYFGDAPIHNQNFAEWPDHDVCRFKIAMYNAMRVGECYGFAHNAK